MGEAGNFKGKVVMDATNPLEMSGGPPPKLVGGVGASGGELNQRALPGAFVVKAFNTVGNAHFYKPEFAGVPPDMFICGDDGKAKEQVSRICTDFGWNPIDIGGIAVSHYLEAAALHLDHYRVHRGELESGIQAVEKVRAVLYLSRHAAPILE